MLEWSVKELADIFDMAASTVRGWVCDGKLHAVKYSNRDGLRISARDLFEFFETKPELKDIFMKKLTTNCTIGGKDCHTALQYLLKVGLIK